MDQVLTNVIVVIFVLLGVVTLVKIILALLARL
jgi:hypothetical protein